MAAGGQRTITIKFDGSAKGLIASAAAVAAALKKVGDDTSGFKKAEAEADALSKKLDQTAKDSKEKGSLMGGGLALGLTAAAPLVSAALVGGVSLGVIGAAAVLQKNNTDVVASFAALKNQVVTEARGASDQVAPYLAAAGKSLQQEFANLGPELHTAFSFAGPDIKTLTTGVDNLAGNAMPGLVTAMRQSGPIVQGISDILGDLGTTATSVLTSVSSHSQEFRVDLDQIGSLIQNVGSVTGSVLPGLASGFGTTADAANTFLGILKPIAPVVGDITGQVLPAVGAFKLFGLATSPLNKLGSKIAGVASNVGGFTKNLTGSDKAGAKAITTTAKLGSAVGKLGNALPYVGAGLALVDAGAEALFGSNAQLSSSLQNDTGPALLATQRELAGNDSKAAALKSSFGALGGFLANQFIPTTQSTEAGLSDVQKAQVNYSTAVAAYGANSKQAAAAQVVLTTATQGQTKQQDQQNAALVKASTDLATLTQSVLDQQNAVLGLQGAQLSLTDADNTYAAAVKAHGKNSEDARTAYVQEQQAILAVVAASGAKAKADDDEAIQHGKTITASQEATDQAVAERRTINDLIGTYALSGRQIPAALLNTAKGLDNTSSAALVTAAEVDNVSARIKAVPAGKKVTVDALTSQAVSELQALGDKVTHLPNGRFNVTANVGSATASLQSVVNKYNGKVITFHVTSTGSIRPQGTTVEARAGGGPIKAHVPYIVGDGGGPEIFVSNDGGHIIGTRDTAALLAGAGGGDTAAPLGGVGGWTGDLVFPIDLGNGVKQVIRISNRELRAKVKAGAGARR